MYVQEVERGGAPIVTPGPPIYGGPDLYRYHAEMPREGY